MAAAPRDCASHLGLFRKGWGGPLCLSGDYSLSHMVPNGGTERGPRGLLYFFHPLPFLPVVLSKIKDSRARVLLSAFDWTHQIWMPDPMTSPIQAGHAFSGSGAALEPQPGAIRHACLASRWEPSGTLGQAVLTTLQAARAPSTVVIYAGRCEIFTCWCQSKCINPVSCDMSSVLSFFSPFWKGDLRNQLWGSMCQPSLIAIEGLSVALQPIISRFLKGTRRLCLSRSHMIPSWDL